MGRGACFADYDTDGRVDAFLVNLGAAGQLLHNTSKGSNHWIKVRLVGVKSNRDGIGADRRGDRRRQQAAGRTGRGFGVPESGRLAAALRPRRSARAERIAVTWPSGIRQIVENVAADQVVTIQEKQ